MRIVIRTCEARREYWPYLREAAPADAELSVDPVGGGMAHFLHVLRNAGGHGILHIEDDVVFCTGFELKCKQAIAAMPETPIQFFSRRKKDLTEGSRWEPGASFSMNQCHYIPPYMNESIAEYYEHWPDRARHPNGYDLLMASFFALHGLRYWLHVPSLVDHRVGKSVIDARRASTNRQSLTFEG